VNAITFPFPRVPSAGTAAAAVHADAHMGVAIDKLGEATAALYERRCTLAPHEARARDAMRDAMVALAHARNLIEPLMTERGQ
jgi:hypothetical protein